MEKLKVLVVDDEPGIRSGINRILRKFSVDYPFMDDVIGFDLEMAPTGEEAIEIINKEQTDIVLLDNKLPGIQGNDVLEYINQKQFDTYVIIITSHASLEVAIRATKNGAYDFVPKPFTPQELKSSMENVTRQIFLRRMTSKLNKEGKQIRFQFLSVMSHELKAPINAVEGYLKMMKQQEFGENIKDYEELIARMEKRMENMRNLIMDMLDLTQIESGKKSRELSTINLTDIAESSIDMMKPYAIQKDVTINLNSPEKLELQADPDELEIILNNLISNAIKYNKQGGTVDCYIRQNKGFATITVTDTGIGMDKTEQTKLFNEFVRIKNEKTKNISGSGLGLSIVRKLVDIYNGDIHVTSKPDEGSSFTVTLPVYTNTGKEAKQDNPEQQENQN
ncbi:MAG: response regulator [Bacteroidales bacterium]|nr:response regulator [Bacteroidales bacterium]MCF8328582.1 response regulator [Bacteroidales bacterium]